MKGQLVAIRIDEQAGGQQVTGLVGQPKNRKQAWTFHLKPDEYPLILEKVRECEVKRVGQAEVLPEL